MDNTLDIKRIEQEYEQKVQKYQKEKEERQREEVEFNLTIKSIQKDLSEIPDNIKQIYGISSDINLQDLNYEQLVEFFAKIEKATNDISGKIMHYLKTDEVDELLPLIGEDLLSEVTNEGMVITDTKEEALLLDEIVSMTVGDMNGDN